MRNYLLLAKFSKLNSILRLKLLNFDIPIHVYDKRSWARAVRVDNIQLY